MRRHWIHACAALVAAVFVNGAAPAMAQNGWPASEPATAKPAPTPVAKPAPIAATVKPAAAPKPATKAKVEAPVAAAAKPAAVSAAAVAPAAKVAPAGTIAPAAPVAAAVPVAPIAAGEIVDVLQQQSEILKRLAAEIESQRAVIKTQQDKINALEIKANAPAPKPVAAAPLTVETGGIKLKVSGLFQGWYAASDASVVDTFRLRRAELKFSGDISPRIKWVVMVDPAKTLALSTTTGSMGGTTVVTGASVTQSGRMMQDAYVSLNWKPALNIEVGQQKLPLGMEGTVSSAKLDVVERALFITDKTRGGGYADIRDFGVMARGKVAGGQLEYAGGVFNGFGENFNDVDKNEDKSMVARLIARPTFAKGLQIGGSIGRDHFTWSDESARERQGVDVAYARGIMGLKGEFMSGRDAAVTRRGGYAQVSARVAKPLTALVRFDAWDPDTRIENSASTVTERDWLGGFTYVLHPSGVWLQANYIRKTYGGLAPTRDVFMTNVQTAW